MSDYAMATTGVILISLPVLRRLSITIHAKVAVDRANRDPYQIGRHAISVVPFPVIARSKAVILGRQ